METDGTVEALPIKEPPENDSVTFESAVKIILQWDSTAVRGVMLFDDCDGNEIDRYLEAVDEIQRSMELMAISESHDDDRRKGKGAIQIAMARLEAEFVNILTCATSPSYSTSSSSLTDSPNSYDDEDYLDYINPPSWEASYHLRSIAERMNSVGDLRNCVQLYIKARKALMEVCFRPLAIEKMSSCNMGRLEIEELEAMIKRWVRAARVCVRVLFANEKQLCEQIFQGFGIAIDDACFMETVKDAAIQLFHFAEAVSSCHRSLERLFNILKLYRTLSDLLPDVEVLFQSKSSEFIRIRAAEILGRLSEAAREILWKFEDAVLGELSEDPAPGGTIDSLTVSVMTYIIRTSDYERTLNELIVSNPSMDLRYSNHQTIPDIMKFIEIGVLKQGTPSAALHLIRIVVILQFKLEEKSKQYKDDALAHLFMMNNVHYIVLKIKDCPKLKKMIGCDYLKQLTGILRWAAIVYQRSTWASVLSCLRSEEGLGSNGRLFTSAVRERIKRFNALFKKVHQTQAEWSVPDLQLREELRISISLMLIHGYRTFIGRYCNTIPNRYFKYTPEDLETAVLDFFEGNPVTQPKLSKPQLDCAVSCSEGSYCFEKEETQRGAGSAEWTGILSSSFRNWRASHPSITNNTLQ